MLLPVQFIAVPFVVRRSIVAESTKQGGHCVQAFQQSTMPSSMPLPVPCRCRCRWETQVVAAESPKPCRHRHRHCRHKVCAVATMRGLPSPSRDPGRCCRESPAARSPKQYHSHVDAFQQFAIPSPLPFQLRCHWRQEIQLATIINCHCARLRASIATHQCRPSITLFITLGGGTSVAAKCPPVRRH